MKRIVLFFVVTALMASMVAVSALTGIAQDTGGQYKAEAAPVADESGQPGEVLYCAPEWLREWRQAEDWWYFWWYKWCHNDEDEWFKLYAEWEWWGPVAEQ